MKKINALELRQSLSKIIETLKRTGEPIMLEKGRRPAAVIISLQDFEERFVEKSANERRTQIVQDILKMSRPSSDKESAEDILREFRGS